MTATAANSERGTVRRSRFARFHATYANEIMADIPNYTDQSPVIQISEVVVG